MAREESACANDASGGGGAPDLGIEIRRAPGQTHIVLTGELDGATAPLLRESFLEVAEGLEGNLVVEISGLTFVDSSGLTLLITEHKNLQANGSSLIIRSPTPMARRAFEITGLHDILWIEPFERPRRVPGRGPVHP